MFCDLEQATGGWGDKRFYGNPESLVWRLGKRRDRKAGIGRGSDSPVLFGSQTAGAANTSQRLGRGWRGQRRRLGGVRPMSLDRECLELDGEADSLPCVGVLIGGTAQLSDDAESCTRCNSLRLRPLSKSQVVDRANVACVRNQDRTLADSSWRSLSLKSQCQS
jgi:hypothetical protein